MTKKTTQEADNFLQKVFPKRNIKKVLFIVPPDADSTLFNYTSAKRGRYPNYPPYGFGILAAHLRQENVEISILNLNSVVLQNCISSQKEEDFAFDQIWKTALAEKLNEYAPDLTCVTCMFTQTHQSLSHVCLEIKNLESQIPLAVGGVHITNSLTNQEAAEQLIYDIKAEFLFQYEGDTALKTFIKVVNTEEPITSLVQVVFNIDYKLLYFSKQIIPKGNELNIIPAYDLMNPIELSKWGKVGSYTGLLPEKKRFATVLSNRGCRAQCTFCSVRNFNGVSVRRRSVSSVIDELLLLRETYGVEHIMWLDDDFLYNRRETIELFDEMVRRKIDITWDCTNGVIVSALTDEIIAAAVESGCIGLNLGIESGNKEILREIKKPGTVKQFLRGAEILRRYPKIFTKVFLIIGFPGETYRQQMDTIEITREMGMDWHLMQILQPLPNTPIFESMVEDGFLDPKEFEAIHIASGAYGKVAKKTEKGRDLLGRDFKDAFNVKDLDAVIPQEKFDDIWAYTNFHQNYLPLFHENRVEKLKQKLLHLEHIYTVIAPSDAMAMFFAGYLQKKLYGKVDNKLFQTLDTTLNQSSYWYERFDDFKLSISQITNEN